MNKILINTLFATSLALAGQIQAASFEPVWEASGFKMPESVVYDSKRSQYYVSNVNMKPMQQDHNGSIGIIKDQGKTTVVEWVTGLSSPKGIEIHDDKLFIADVKELVVIDLEKAQISARYPAPDTILLNGIATTNNQVFVSDWMGNAIYTLGDHGLELWFQDKALDNPNGLYVKEGYLYVGSWGTNPKPDFSTETTGGLKRISLKTKKLEHLTDGKQWMNLDGLHAGENNTWLATDFIKGDLLVINTEGDITRREKLAPSAADFFYNKQKNLVVVPFLMGNKVVAYRYQ